MVRIRNSEEAAAAKGAAHPSEREADVEAAVKEVTRDQPLPVVTALLRPGVALGSSGLSYSPGETSVGRLSDLGRELVADLERQDDAGQLGS
jgi:hypothetical protein